MKLMLEIEDKTASLLGELALQANESVEGLCVQFIRDMAISAAQDSELLGVSSDE